MFFLKKRYIHHLKIFYRKCPLRQPSLVIETMTQTQTQVECFLMSTYKLHGNSFISYNDEIRGKD